MKSKPFARLATLAAVAAAFAVVVPAAQAATPAPGYEQFAGCPSPEENPEAVNCINSIITGGYFKMGSKNVPITNPIRLSGGFNPAKGKGQVSASPAGGLSASKQKVPGGVIGLTGLTWLAEFFGSDALTLYAVTELAGVPTIHFGELRVELPIKVHLINPVLGSKCYVGSVSNPIQLNVFTGTTNPPPPNEPISGKAPTFSSTSSPEIVHLDDGVFVDNSFAAPGASGCTLTLFGFIPLDLDDLVNLQAGLPSPAGTNATSQEIDQELTFQTRVYP